MSKVFDVAVLVGSLRKESLNRKVALALAERAPANLKLEIVLTVDILDRVSIGRVDRIPRLID